MKSIDIFTGAGGLGMGVHRAGFKQVLAIDNDKYCCSTLQSNQHNGVKELSDWTIYNDNIEAYDFSRFENEIDLISGGPPCQPFSLGGKHSGDVDQRNMFPHAIRTVREVRPKAFIFENVKGLTRPSFFNYFEYIRLQLTFPNILIKKNEQWIKHFSRLEKQFLGCRMSGLHYKVLTKVLNAADYGIAQKRERVFFVGFRSDIQVNWSFPISTHSQSALLWSKLHGKYWDKFEVPKKQRIFSPILKSASKKIIVKPREMPWETVRSALFDLPDPKRYSMNQISNHIYKPGAKSYKGHTGSSLDEPAKTLKAGNHGVPGGENMIRKIDGKVRYFTVRESARLQSFPDEFIFNCSWGESMRQLGNAVPVNLASILAKSIQEQLEVTEL